MCDRKLPFLYKEKSAQAMRRLPIFSTELSYSSASSNYKPSVSSKSWCIYHGQEGVVVAGHACNTRREVASLTKIMTCLLVIRTLESSPSSFLRYIKISRRAASMEGTSCKVKKGDRLKIIDLLYGLMLPSGNDAAMALAEYFGRKFLKTNRKLNIRDPVRAFLSEMNSLAREIGLHDTFFANPHGLSVPKNKSTARDLCLLASASLENSLFRKIVNTRNYYCYVAGSQSRCLSWENTNKLLSKGFTGVKTGVTFKAGPCLCVSKGNLIVVILACVSMEQRWAEATALINYGSLLIDF